MTQTEGTPGQSAALAGAGGSTAGDSPSVDVTGVPADSLGSGEGVITGGATLAGEPGAATHGAVAGAGALGIRESSQVGDIWRRFRRNKLALFGLFLIGIVVLMAIFAPLIAPFDPRAQDLTNTVGSPSGKHLFGTDEVGRDQFSRTVYGSRIALIVGLSVILLTVTVGIVLGAIAGYLGGGWDSVIMRIADIFFAFPLLVGAIVIVIVAGQGVLPVIVALALFGWASVARLLRSSILSVREAEYVEAARSLGAGPMRIITRHVLPNALAPVLVYATFNVGVAIIAEASLSFLGVGVKPDVPEWGNMIAAGQKFFGYRDFLWAMPSIAVVITVLGFIFAGDGMRDALDPKLR